MIQAQVARKSDETIPQHLRRCVERLREIASESMERYELNSLASDIEDSLEDLEDDEETLRKRAAEMELLTAEYRLDTARMERELLMQARVTPQTCDSLSRVGLHASAVEVTT